MQKKDEKTYVINREIFLQSDVFSFHWLLHHSGKIYVSNTVIHQEKNDFKIENGGGGKM